MREDLLQNFNNEHSQNPIQKESIKTTETHPSTEPVSTFKLKKYLKNPKYLALAFLFFIIVALSLLSLFVNQKPSTQIKDTFKPTPLPLNKPTSIPQLPEKYSDKFNQINQELQNIQPILPPKIDENIGIN